ncbi:MAG: DeoR/GlpR family DNA-binding transcription regulator [Bifidobacteriaceae bacterium]|nr:DeoR/GlpR family DNA-binding transcription regulator [Bifidobacteriaceae bacterium]
MAAMLAEQRQSLILEQLRAQGAVRVSRLAADLAASEMTVRRDIDQLAAQGLCRKVHGGACLPAGAAQEPGFAAKAAANQAAKQAIGRAAAKLVQSGQAVGISAGTTSYWVAVELARRPARDRITVVTNSVPAAAALAEAAAADPADPAPRPATGPVQVIMTGGTLTPSRALVGPLADLALGRLSLDWLFLGVHGLDVEAGLTTPNVAEAATNRALMAAAQTTVVTADCSKWGIAALAQIAPLDQVARLVTDAAPPPEAAQALQRRQIDLTIARLP